MSFRFKLALPVPAMVAVLVAGANPAPAHSFNVALVIPMSGAAEARGRQVLQGFMQATAERDGHPDQDSDGHLGGLDVYVTVIDGSGTIDGAVRYAATQGGADIVAVFGPAPMRERVGELIDGTGAVLLPPGDSPFPDPVAPEVAAFVSAYENEHGNKPSAHSARGYNAARRIDAAIRGQGGVDDPAALLRHFEESARDFNW